MQKTLEGFFLRPTPVFRGTQGVVGEGRGNEEAGVEGRRAQSRRCMTLSGFSSKSRPFSDAASARSSLDSVRRQAAALYTLLSDTAPQVLRADLRIGATRSLFPTYSRTLGSSAPNELERI